MNRNKTDTYIIESEDANTRIDTFLANIYSDVSRSFVQKQIKNGNVLVNGNVVKSSAVLKAEDVVTILFESQTDYTIEPENIPVEIRYEDNSMLVVNKPSGMLTHPTSTEMTGTLVNAMLYYTKGKLSDCNGANRPGIVHRLDRNTSGLLMIAKTNDAYEYLKTQMQQRTIEKKYYAVVCGNLQLDEGTITKNINRHKTKPAKMTVDDSGKLSITHYKVLERFGTHTFIEINLETGRTHQIRVHMSYIGHPLVNDTLYGGCKLPVKTKEQVLQAFSLKFVSPHDLKERVITINYDDDIIKTLNYLRSKK